MIPLVMVIDIIITYIIRNQINNITPFFNLHPLFILIISAMNITSIYIQNAWLSTLAMQLPLRMANTCTVVQSWELPTRELHWSRTSWCFGTFTLGCFADKHVVGEYYYRTIQINVIIHLNTGINMLTLFLKYHYLDHHFASAKFSNA